MKRRMNVIRDTKRGIRYKCPQMEEEIKEDKNAMLFVIKRGSGIRELSDDGKEEDERQKINTQTSS